MGPWWEKRERIEAKSKKAYDRRKDADIFDNELDGLIHGEAFHSKMEPAFLVALTALRAHAVIGCSNRVLNCDWFCFSKIEEKVS